MNDASVGGKDGDFAPFTSARPAAGPLLSSQPHAATNHAEQPLWALLATPMSARGARPAAARRRRCSPFRLTSAHQPVGQGWPYWALSGTAVAVVPVARRVDRRAYSRTRRGCAPGGHPCRLGTDASPAERCFTQRASRPPGSGVGSGLGVARSRGVAATLRRCGHMGWDPARRFGAGLGGYSCDAGNKPQPSAGPSPRPALTEVARRSVRTRSPAPQRLWNALVSKAEASRPAGERALGTASAHRHPARVWHPERH